MKPIEWKSMDCPLLFLKHQNKKDNDNEQVWYHSKVHALVFLSFLSIVFDFLHDFSLDLSHQLSQRTVGRHRFHKRVL